MKNRWLRMIALSLLPLAAAAPTVADELEDLRNLRDTTISLLNQLVEQGILTREKADALIQQAQHASKNTPPAMPAGAAASGSALAQGAQATPGSAAAPNGPAAPANAATPGTAPAGSATAPVAPGVVRVPYVPETVKQQIREEVKQDVLTQAKAERWGDPGALPSWLDRITLSGDVRFRYQGDRFPIDGAPNATPEQLSIPQFGAYPLTDTTDPINILRIRARFGVDAKLGDTVTAGVRIATGGVGVGTNSASESQTLGNYNSRESVGIDRAYVAYHPLSWLSVSGGRLGNPFFTNTTLVWANDLSLEGAALSLTPWLNDRLGFFATAGAFPILDVEPSPLNSAAAKWMYGYQAGLHWQPTQVALVRFAASLYDYRHLEGTSNPTIYSTVYNQSAAPFRQGGNSVFDIDAQANTVAGTQNYVIGLVSKFNEANASASLDLGFGRTHVMWDLDYVKNLGFNHDEILNRVGFDIAERTTGAQTRVAVGDNSFARRYAWQAFVGYRYVQRDAVVDAFTDADFHLGGTDTQGYILGGEFAFETNSTLRARWMSGKQIDGLPLAINVLQIDVTAAF